jgi:hypothetical protein
MESKLVATYETGLITPSSICLYIISCKQIPDKIVEVSLTGEFCDDAV